MPFDPTSYIMGKAAGGGGGGDITVESKSVTSNGEYTAPSGKAYSPVTVNVPNSYSAADEGKVVDNGALVAQTAHAEVTQNGLIDTTLNNSVTVNVSGGNATFATGTFTPAENTTALSVDTGINCDYFIVYTKTPSATFGTGTRVQYCVVDDLKEEKTIIKVYSNASGTSWSGISAYVNGSLTKSGTVVSGTFFNFVAGVTYTWLAFKVS